MYIYDVKIGNEEKTLYSKEKLSLKGLEIEAKNMCGTARNIVLIGYYTQKLVSLKFADKTKNHKKYVSGTLPDSSIKGVFVGRIVEGAKVKSVVITKNYL